ncbi:DUF7556 family protein [Halococcoides cellulosivorans]|uniref:DUF7556 family protein n=1 Tax=Halococcoides cellulosivorans TaxID=1679096 RepID=UPI0015717989|nr:hypothetical protein [Halococcoides cellulosivorans]
MSQETDAIATSVAEDPEVMASVEHGRQDTFILADVTCDDAYLTVPLESAAALPEWR